MHDSKKCIGFMLKYSRHGNCQILETKVWRGNKSRTALQGPEVSRESELRRSLSALSALRGRPTEGSLHRTPCFKDKSSTCAFSQSDTINYRIRSYLSLLSSAVSVYLRTSSLSLDELFYILKGSRIIESLYHFAQQKIFLEQPLLSSQRT